MPNIIADKGGKLEEFPVVFTTYYIIRKMKIKNSK